MARQRLGSGITAVAAIGFWVTAALHTAGYSSVIRSAGQAPETVRRLLPLLWLALSSDLVVVGLIVALVAFRPGGPARIILTVAAICPLAAAGLQIRFIGFIPPTAILIGVGIVTLIGASVLPPTRLTSVGDAV
jgi:hypothetical protein